MDVVSLGCVRITQCLFPVGCAVGTFRVVTGSFRGGLVDGGFASAKQLIDVIANLVVNVDVPETQL